ncbi:MAG TPA: hypothetical protein PLU58_11620 [Saprospiraceae bacterium]|nr:hypothetical protein [Saprospiraceae bacterium]
MGLVFWRIYQSIHYHFEWFEKFRVIEELRRLSGGLNLDYVKTYYDISFKWHLHMRQEIFQTIETCDEKTQVYMFEELIPYLSDWRIASIPYDYIEKIVTDYNEAEEIRFNEDVKKRDEEHRRNVDYSKPHMAEIPQEKNETNPFLHRSIFGRFNSLPKKNNYYYEYWGYPDFIDTEVLPEYYNSLGKLQQSFRDNTSLYTKLYIEGKYVPKDRMIFLKNEFENEIKNEVKALPTSPEEELLSSIIEKPNKLLLDLSVPQIACLFMAFREMGIIKETVNTELSKFISANFSSKKSKDISTKTLGDQFSNLDNKAIEDWLDFVKDFRLALLNLKK